MRVETRTSSPSLARLYAGVVASAPLRRMRPARRPELPDVALELTGVTVDRARLAAYDRVCGFAVGDRLPLTYPHVLAFPLHIALMARADFPYSMAGLVHTRNIVTRHRAVLADEPLDIRVAVEHLARHAKGATVDFVTDVSVAGTLVWTERSTYLARGGAVPDDVPPAEIPSDDWVPGPSVPTVAQWRLGRDVGRRYAAVSGDVNPMHLSPLAARAFGFPGVIAHGMWAKARAIAAIDARVPDHVTADVAFRSPLVLPAPVRLVGEATPLGRRLAVVSARSGRPHLLARVAAPDQA